MKKKYIGTIELTQGAAVVGDSMNMGSSIMIYKVPRGTYHCYSYEPDEDLGDGCDSRTYVGVEYGASIDKTNDFELVGEVSVNKCCGIFEAKYYNVHHGYIDGTKKASEDVINKVKEKWEKKVVDFLSTNELVKDFDQRGVFFNTKTDEEKKAVIYKRLDKNGNAIEFKIGVHVFCDGDAPEENLNKEVTLSCGECYPIKKEWYEKCVEELCVDEPMIDEEQNNYCSSEESSVEHDEVTLSCDDCSQTFFTQAATNVSSEVEDVYEEDVECVEIDDVDEGLYNTEKHKIESFYYELNGDNVVTRLVIPKVNEIIEGLMGGQPKLVHWYRGMTVEKLDGKIHKLTIDFD